MAESILSYSFKSYSKNIKMISFFAIPALIGLLIPTLVNTPVFSALGASFVRTGSIPDLTAADFGVIIISLLVSLYMVSFAMVNINIVIKAQRTGTSVKNEVLKSITGSTLNVFILYLLGIIALLIIQLLTLELGAQNWLAPILSLLVWLPLFYAPAGLVIDELRPWRAAEKSFKMIFSKFHYFVMWLLIAFVLLSLLDLIFLNLGAVFPVSTHKVGSLFVLLINSLVLMPFLIVLQTQVYLSKYTILD